MKGFLSFAILVYFMSAVPAFAADKMYRTHTASNGDRITTTSPSGFVPAPSQITHSRSPYDSYTHEGLVSLANKYSAEKNYSGVINVSEYLRYRKGYCTDETMALEVQAAYHRGGQQKAMKHLTDIKKHKGENGLMRHLKSRSEQDTLDSFSLEGWSKYFEGRKLQKSKGYATAIPYLEKAIELDEKNDLAWMMLAVYKGKIVDGTVQDRKNATLEILREGLKKTHSGNLKIIINRYMK